MKKLLITPGEPAGIGPEITIKIAQQPWVAELIAVADPDLLLDRAKQLNLPLSLVETDLQSPATPHQPGTLKIIPIKLRAPAKAGQLDPQNADYVLQTLSTAATFCVEKKAQALVTGPVHKGILNTAGFEFTGHTEFFAQHCNVAHTLMLFVVDQLKVAIATTHIPLAKVSTTLTKERLRTALTILNEGLKQQFHLPSPRILVCGLNPHAGENGYLGREEIDTISPVLKALNKDHYLLEGPLPADTIFTPRYLERADAILAMYHDQALPIVKYMGFGHAVNVTLGLPFIRTSVDHGTALDIAAKHIADDGSMKAALKLALELASV